MDRFVPHPLVGYFSAMHKGWRKRLLDIMQAPGGPDMATLSKRAGLSHGYLHSLYTPKKGSKALKSPSVENFLAIAEAAGVEPGWLLMGDEKFRVRIPILGTAASGELWHPAPGNKPNVVDFDLGPNFDVVAIEVRGDAMAPVYRDQDFLVCQRQVGAHADNLIGRDCAVRTTSGQHYLKILRKGTRPGLFHLRSYNPSVDDIENVALEWAAPVVWIKRGGR